MTDDTTVVARSAVTAARRAAVALLIFILGVAAIFYLDPDRLYEWVKAIHIIAVIAWMAGMLYLPRLFVYHSQVDIGSAQSEIFKTMERNLLRVIINPAMIVVWVLGLWLAWDHGWFTFGWLHAKIVLVIILSGVHGYFARAVRLFAEDRNTKSTRYWRLMNEVPTLLMMAIVILVVVKPF